MTYREAFFHEAAVNGRSPWQRSRCDKRTSHSGEAVSHEGRDILR